MTIYSIQKLCIVLWTIFFFCPILLIGQDQDTTIYKTRLFQGNLDIGDSRGGFARDIRNKGIGVSVSWLFQTKIDGAVFIGPALDWHRYQTISNVGLDTEERISTDDIAVMGQMRLYPNLTLGPLELYFEGLIGPRAFYSPVSFTDLNTGEQIDFRLEELNFGLSFGAGTGVSINVSEYSYFINIGIQYISGTSFRFLAPEFDAIGMSTEDVVLRNARYELLKYQLGFSLSF